MDGTGRRTSKRRATAIEENDRNIAAPSKKLSSNEDGSRPSTRSPSEENAGSADPLEFLHRLSPLPKTVPNVKKLTKAEVEELERVLELSSDGDDSWRPDWAGNLALAEKDILNPSQKTKEKKSFRQALSMWALASPANTRYLRNLIRFVCSMDHVPTSLKKIFGTINDSTDAEELINKIRRATLDPQVLEEDGWTIVKSEKPEGASGGANHIGDRIRCDGYDGVIIAYVHDPNIGDLWKAVWTDDLVAFDLEVEELLDAKKKWERRQNQFLIDPKLSRRSARFPVSSDFTVKGIEYGIVLGASYSKGARPGVYWPARVMHASESNGHQGKRSSTKQKVVDLVFLAPYWSSDDQPFRGRRVEGLSESGNSSIFEANPLLQIETVDASDEMIKEYPFSTNGGLDIAQLQLSFRFTGLPKAIFGRYLDAHRLAMALREYSKQFLQKDFSAMDQATAGLFETHPMSVQAPAFPPVVLHLPFSYILSQLPRPANISVSDTESKEPILKINNILESMKPPYCWGEMTDETLSKTPTKLQQDISHDGVTSGKWISDLSARHSSNEESHVAAIEGFVSDFPLLNEYFSRHSSNPHMEGVLSNLTRLILQIAEEEVSNGNGETPDVEIRRKKLRGLVKSWSLVKLLGEESLAAIGDCNSSLVLKEWRRAAERIYSFMITMFSDGQRLGNGISSVITDSLCNGHRTANGCFERNVRLPAALRGAKMAGAGKIDSIRLITAIPERYFKLAEGEILPKAHSKEYLKRMKSRCVNARTDDEVLMLTEDSDGNGGEDTVGSRGTWMASIAGVAGALHATDLVVQGDCVNAFCATRPPGHHAGRNLHPMKAVSNGFCVLNPVACAAIYAVSSISNGGLGLGRVCVIDFDVHHGNGTQDILCSTYDPRFLYVSLHAGGAHINGQSMDDDPNHELHDLGINTKGGIFPGRCGDVSPHQGVLNLPLGAKVTSHAVGTALLNHVSPRVESFCPDLIILSAGFDGHKNDPMGLGGLSSEDFGHITQVVCQLAVRCCSGRVVSVLEGGYGVPCCRPQRGILSSHAPSIVKPDTSDVSTTAQLSNAPEAPDAQPSGNVSMPDTNVPNGVHAQPVEATKTRPQPSRLLDLGEDLPGDMDDQVPYVLQSRLEKCHAEGFIECVREHVQSLARCNKLKT